VINRASRLCVLAALAAGTLTAVDWKSLRPEGYVSDFAHVVDPQSKAALEQYCSAVEQSTGAQIALVTIPSLENEPIEDVANTIFHSWGVGSKGKNEGIMLLLSVGDRRSRLEVGYGLEPIIPDGFAGSVLDDIRPALREQHYGEALMAAAQTIGTTIAKGKGVNINAQMPRVVHQHTRNTIPWPLILGGIFLVIWLMRSGGSGAGYGGGGGGGFLPGLILGSTMGRSTWGGRSGGGFGGYDSGDGFGGFGGGDSGGGGASSDW
jgi:uncharacterized protein